MASSRDESSPDPLTMSWNSSYAIRPSSSPKKPSVRFISQRDSQAIQRGHPNLPQSSAQQQQTLIFNTPSKTSNGTDNSSPWRVRVTVQTEKDNGYADYRPMTRTTTTKVPIKGEDENAPSVQIFSRHKSCKNMPQSTPIKGNEEKSRKKRKPTCAIDDNQTIQERNDDLGRSCEKGRAKRSSPVAKTHAKRRRKDAGLELSNQRVSTLQREPFTLTPLHEKPENEHLLWKHHDLSCTPFGQKTTAKKIRERVPTPMKPLGYDENLMSPLPLTSPIKNSPQAKTRFPSLVATNDDGSPDFRSDDEASSVMGGIEDDTLMLDRSLAESEGFSMVSIESLKTQRLIAETEAELADKAVYQNINHESVINAKHHLEPTVQIPSLLHCQREYSIEKSSSPKCTTSYDSEVAMLSRVSPLPNIERQTLPNGMIVLSDKPISARTAEAQNTTLRSGAKSYEGHQVGYRSLSPEKSAQNNQGAFGDFGEENPPQLSAVLAMSEHLAHSKPGFPSELERKYGTRANLYEDDAGGRNCSAYARLPTPAYTASYSSSLASADLEIRDEQPQPMQDQPHNHKESSSESQYETSQIPSYAMSWRPATPVRICPQPQELTRTQDVERQWQIQRDDVILQASQANASQVVYINSDESPPSVTEQSKEGHEHAEMTEPEDIWQEEAERSLEESQSFIVPASNRILEENTQDETSALLRDLLGEDTQPLRGKLPRNWRRTSGSHFLYRDEVESPARSCDGANLSFGPNKQESLFKGFQKANIFSENTAEADCRKSDSQELLQESILSDADRRERQRCTTPKEARLARLDTDPHGLQDLNSADTAYFSSDHSTGSSIRTIEAESNHSDVSFPDGERDLNFQDQQPSRSTVDDDNSFEPDTSDLRQLQRDLRTTATAKSKESIIPPFTAVNGARLQSTEMRILKPGCNGKYARLFEDSPYSPTKQIKTGKVVQNDARHIESALTITIDAARPHPNLPPQGIFSRLSSWLYPPVPLPQSQMKYAYDWNRNHYLVLNHFWNQQFQGPGLVHPIDTQTCSQQQRLAALPADLRVLVSACVTRFNGKQPLVLNLSHCLIAAQFISEASDPGIPLLCDGRRRVPKYIKRQSAAYDPKDDSSEDEDGAWPKRNASGRVVRCKQYWTSDEVVKGIYGLWLIKTHEAGRKKATMPAECPLQH